MSAGWRRANSVFVRSDELECSPRNVDEIIFIHLAVALSTSCAKEWPKPPSAPAAAWGSFSGACASRLLAAAGDAEPCGVDRADGVAGPLRCMLIS